MFKGVRNKTIYACYLNADEDIIWHGKERGFASDEEITDRFMSLEQVAPLWVPPIFLVHMSYSNIPASTKYWNMCHDTITKWFSGSHQDEMSVQVLAWKYQNFSMDVKMTSSESI